MRKIILIIMLCVFCAPATSKAAAYLGVAIDGECCRTPPGLNAASAVDMALLYTSIMTQHTLWTERVIQAISAGTKAQQAEDMQTTQAQLQAQAEQREGQTNAEAKIASLNRNIFDTPVNPCPNSPGQGLGYYFNKVGVISEEGIGKAVAFERDIAGGLTEDMNKRDLILGELAKNFDKHGFLFPAPIYTPAQNVSAGDAFDLLLPDWKNPRPKNMKSGGIEEAKYLVAEARVRILRQVLAHAWFTLTNERSPSIHAKEIYQFIGPNQNKYAMVDYAPTIDSKTGLMKPGTEPRVIEVEENGMVSPRILYEAPFQYYTNTEVLAQIGGKGAAAVLKEDLKLHAFEYKVINEMRKDVQFGNLLKAVSLLYYYTKLVGMPENQIAR